MKKSSIHILIVTSVALCAGATLPFLFGHSTIDPEQQSVKSEVPYCVTSPSVPDKITFAGQEIDLTRYDHRERMDREQMSFTYMHSTTMLTIKRANRFFPIIEPILKENGVPDDFKYLAVIESNLNTLARSPAGAAGMWQFMQTTGREFGLEVNPNIDERYHVEKATRAACQYLKDAYQRYGNWLNLKIHNYLLDRLSRQHTPSFNRPESNNCFAFYKLQRHEINIGKTAVFRIITVIS